MLAERSDLLAEHSREPDDSHLDGEGTLSQDVVSEQVRLVYGQARVGLVVTLLLAGVALYATRALVPIAHAGAWCAAFAVLVGGRWWLLRAYARAGHRSTEALVWRQRWIVSMLLSGLVWGAGGLVFSQGGPPENAVFVAFLLGGLAAGAIATQSGIFPGFVAFAVPALVPLIVWFFLQGGELYLWMGAMSSLYLLALAATAHFVAENTDGP